MVGIYILLPVLAKAISASIVTMDGASIDTDKVKEVMVSPRDFFSTDACAYVSWNSLGVALLLSSMIFGKYAQPV